MELLSWAAVPHRWRNKWTPSLWSLCPRLGFWICRMRCCRSRMVEVEVMADPGGGPSEIILIDSRGWFPTVGYPKPLWKAHSKSLILNHESCWMILILWSVHILGKPLFYGLGFKTHWSRLPLDMFSTGLFFDMAALACGCLRQKCLGVID